MIFFQPVKRNILSNSFYFVQLTLRIGQMQPLLVGRTPDEAILFPRLVNINELSNDEFDIDKVANNTLERIPLGVPILLGGIS